MEDTLITDENFKRYLESYDKWCVDNNRKKIAKEFLEQIEMFNHSKEEISFKNYSLEHIMPQKLNKEWEAKLGNNSRNIHDKYLNRIGNLTLTTYNSELSNKTFEEKLNMPEGFKSDRLHLSEYISDTFNHWNEDAINRRTEAIIEKALEIWKYPQ